ncbi:MAG: alcohol dehydrogenase catalytic domain-containing protein, partial [Steroidobacteraceae bacterium]
MKETFRALLAQEHEGKVRAVLQDLRPADLPDHGLLVEISHSTLNYKDALAVSGKGRICRSLPMVCGIDLAGKVLESRSSRFHPGDAVIVNGFGLSERHWGGYSEYQRVDPDWAIRLPDAFNAEQAMGIGTAGYTAMLCVDALQRHGLKQEEGPILVTGASGGVGSVAVMLLAKLGYDVTASTGRATANAEFLTRLGARTVVDREEFARQSKPLETE